MWVLFIAVVILALLYVGISLSRLCSILRDLTENTRQIKRHIGDINIYAAQDRLTSSSLAEILDNQRKAKKRDDLCLSCKTKECLAKKGEFFVCKRYTDAGL